jgi:hypothetical protein
MILVSYLNFVGYLLYSLHVCVWAHHIQQLHLMIPCNSSLCVMCIERFLGGSQGVGKVWPPLVTCSVRDSAPKKIFGQFLLFLVIF